MSTEQILGLLIQERDRLNGAIAALGGTVGGGGKIGNTTGAGGGKASGQKKREWTPEQRAAHTARMKAFWAKRHKAKKT